MTMLAVKKVHFYIHFFYHKVYNYFAYCVYSHDIKDYTDERRLFQKL